MLNTDLDLFCYEKIKPKKKICKKCAKRCFKKIKKKYVLLTDNHKSLIKLFLNLVFEEFDLKLK